MSNLVQAFCRQCGMFYMMNGNHKCTSKGVNKMETTNKAVGLDLDQGLHVKYPQQFVYPKSPIKLDHNYKCAVPDAEKVLNMVNNAE